MKKTKKKTRSAAAAAPRRRSKRQKLVEEKRQRQQQAEGGAASPSAVLQPRGVPTGKVLVIHANEKEYGRGARIPSAHKASNRLFPFTAKDFLAMRGDGLTTSTPYPAASNKLLPLPRPTYTEFINRARRARILPRLYFLYCSTAAKQPPRMDWQEYEIVIWAGVTFRRFAKIWTPERNALFKPSFQQRVRTVLLCVMRCAEEEDGPSSGLGRLPGDMIWNILAFAASKRDASRDAYDTLQVVHSGAKHLFLPAPGSSANRERLFDAAFGLGR